MEYKMSRPKIDSIVKMEDARNIEALINSDEKALRKTLKNHQILRNQIFKLVSNKKAKQYRTPSAV
jgi:hypothetical protein